MAVLGAGMHPWGKWGRNFVEYGLAAANDALADAGVAWRDVRVRLGRRHHPQQGTPKAVHRRRHLRPGPGLDRGPGLLQLRRLRLGGPGHQQRPGPDPGRPVRRGPGGRGRHHPQGLLRPGGRGPQGRPRLAALPPAGRHQPHLLRPLRPPAHGPLRRHRRGLRPGEGEELEARPGQRVRPLPQGGDHRGGAGLADGGRPAAAARDLPPPATAGRPWCSRPWPSPAAATGLGATASRW